jgi:hypothetical protein
MIHAAEGPTLNLVKAAADRALIYCTPNTEHREQRAPVAGGGNVGSTCNVITQRPNFKLLVLNLNINTGTRPHDS